MLTDDVLAKLAPYADSDKSDEVIALVEDIPLETVVAWRASLTVAPEVAPEPTPQVTLESGADAKAKAKADKVKPAKVAPVAPPPDAPASVHVIARGVALGQNLGTFARPPRRGDIYHGEQAAALWKNHRSAVEPWPKA